MIGPVGVGVEVDEVTETVPDVLDRVPDTEVETEELTDEPELTVPV